MMMRRALCDGWHTKQLQAEHGTDSKGLLVKKAEMGAIRRNYETSTVQISPEIRVPIGIDRFSLYAKVV